MVMTVAKLIIRRVYTTRFTLWHISVNTRVQLSGKMLLTL